MPLPFPRFHALAAGGALVCLALAGASAQEAPQREIEADAEAGEEAELPEGIEEIRVRARAGGGFETDIPASVTTFDPATIQALGVEDISDLSRVTPNVSIVQPGATQATFFVRGVGLSDFSSNAAGAVTIFQDDVAINAPAIQTPQLFDLEGVDIVRGPQGTGHFRNASAGAIRVRSRRPTGNYSAQLRATLGRYQAESGLGARHALIQDYEGALELPITEQLLSSRFAFRLRDADPYKINGCGEALPIAQRLTRLQAQGPSEDATEANMNVCGERGNTYLGRRASDRSTLPEGLPRRVGDQHNWAARGILALTPPDSDWEVHASGHGSRLDQQSTLGQVIGTDRIPPPVGTTGFGGQVLAIGDQVYIEPDVAEEIFGLDGQGGLCQAAGTGLCTNTNVLGVLARNLSRRRPLDIRPYRGDFDQVGNTARDAYGGFLSARGPLGDYELFALASYDAYERAADEDFDFSADPLIAQIGEDDAWQTYEELALSGELQTLLVEWELGGYYLYEDLSAQITNVILDNTDFRLFRDFDQQIHSAALWGDFTWDFLDELTLEGGVRWNYEKKDFDYLRVFTNRLLATEPSLSETWSEPTGQLSLTWHIQERINLYARYTRGFKAGHYNSIATERLDKLLALPETIDAWEGGLRGATRDGRLSGTGAFFYYHYTDYQVFLFSSAPQQPPTLEIVNAHQAELYGVEVEAQLRPLRFLVPRFLEHLELSANASWLQGQYIDFSQEQSFREGGGFSTVTYDYSGNSLANAPRYKFSGTADWTFDLGRFGYLIPRYDVSWSDDQFFDAAEGRGAVTRTGQQALPKLTVAQTALWLHNVRLAYRTPTGNVEVAGWARNVTDEVYKTFVFDASRFAGVVIHFVGEPRTVGVDLTITF